MREAGTTLESYKFLANDLENILALEMRSERYYQDKIHKEKIKT